MAHTHFVCDDAEDDDPIDAHDNLLLGYTLWRRLSLLMSSLSSSSSLECSEHTLGRLTRLANVWLLFARLARSKRCGRKELGRACCGARMRMCSGGSDVFFFAVRNILVLFERDGMVNFTGCVNVGVFMFFVELSC